MQKITRIYVGNYGIDMAWYDGIVFDMTDPDSGEPTDTIINLENGGGKTTLLSFIFSCFETGQERFLKHIQNKNHRFSQYFARDGLPGIVLIEWLMPARTAGGAPFRLVMGQAVSIKPNSEREDVERIFFSFEERQGLNFNSVPAPKLSSSPAMNMAELSRWMHEAHKVSPDFFQTRVQGDWQRHLRDERLIDIEMLQLQVNFSAQEGGIDTGFLTFTSEPEFLRKFFDLTLDHERSASVRLAVVNTCDKLRRKPHFEKCLEELQKLHAHLSRFSEISADFASAAQSQADALTNGSGLVLSLDAMQREQKQLAEEEAAQAKVQDETSTEAERTARKLADDVVVLTKLRHDRAVAAAALAQGAADEKLEAAKAQVLHIQAAQARTDLDNLEEKLRGLDESAKAAESGLEPLRSLVDQKGGILRRRLFEEEQRLNAEAKSAGDIESAAKKLRTELNKELTTLGKSEQLLITEQANLLAAEASFANARGQLVADELLNLDEEVADAVLRWGEVEREKKGRASELELQSETYRAEESQARSQARSLTQQAAGLKASIAQHEEFVAEGEAEHEQLSQLAILRQAAEADTANPDSPALLSALRRLGISSEREVALCDVRLAALHSTKSSIVETEVAGASPDVNELVARLRALGVKSAKPFNVYIAKAVPDADQARALVASNPARFLGVCVASAELENARAVLGQPLGLASPVMVSVAALEQDPTGQDRFVVSAQDDSAFNVPAAAVLLSTLDSRIAAEEARRKVYSERLSDVQKADQRLQAYAGRFGGAAVTRARTEILRLTEESEVAAERAAAAEIQASELQDKASSAKTEAATCRTASLTASTNAARLVRFSENHESGRPARLSRLESLVGELAAKAEARDHLQAQVGLCDEQERQAFREKLLHEQAAGSLAAERSELKYYSKEALAPEDLAQAPADLDGLRVLYADAARVYEAEAKTRLGLLHEQQESTRLKLTEDKKKFSEDFPGVLMSDMRPYLGGDFPRLLQEKRLAVETLDRASRAADSAHAVAKRERDLYAKANKTMSVASPEQQALDDVALSECIDESACEQAKHAAQAQTSKAEAGRCRERSSRAAAREALAKNTASSLRASLSLPELLNADPLPLEEDVSVQATRLIQEFQSKAKSVQTARSKAYKAFEELRTAASNQALQQVEPDIAAQLLNNDFDAACADSSRLLDGILDRIGTTQSSIDGMTADFEACVGELTNLANSAISLLNSAATNKRVPAAAPYVGGKPILKMRARFQEVGLDARKQQLRNYLDSLIATGVVPARGPELVAEALLRIHGKALGFQMLKMVPDEALQYVPVDKIQNSGGEGVVMAMFLYMLINQLRSETQAKLKKAGGGPLILDNPFAKATTPTLWKAQRLLAQAMDVQLVFATALPDYNTVGEFGRFVRLRKAGKNNKTGRWHLEAVDFKLAEPIPATA